MKFDSKAYYQTHKAEHAAYGRKWRKKNKEQCRQRYQQLKTEVLSYYGQGKEACVNCGFSNPLALCIDHINNNGAEHRRASNIGSGISFYCWLKSNGFPEGYQTLCFNCNIIKDRTKPLVE